VPGEGKNRNNVRQNRPGLLLYHHMLNSKKKINPLLGIIRKSVEDEYVFMTRLFLSYL
jgi:hypothetical protein